MNLALDMPSPTGEELKAARLKAGLTQVESALLMGFPVQIGSRGGTQSSTWQAFERSNNTRTMQGPSFAMFQLLTGTHPQFKLVPIALADTLAPQNVAPTAEKP